MSAAEKRKTPIPLLVNNSVTSSGVRGWLLIRSRAAMIFCLTTSLVALLSPFPVPQYPRYLHASSRFIAWRVSPLIVNSGAASCSLRFLSLSTTNKYVFFTLIWIPQCDAACRTCLVWFSGCSMRKEIQCVAVCCSVLQCVAAWSNVLQCVAVCCSVLQCVAVCRNVSLPLRSF